MFFRHPGRALCSEASNASSLGVASSTSASAAFFRNGPQCPHCAACFISSLVFASGRSPAATSSHSASPMHSGVGGDGLGTRIRKISLCTNWCLCSFRLQSWQDSTWRWASLRSGSESCSEPDTLVSLQRNEPIQFVAVEMFVEWPCQNLLLLLVRHWWAESFSFRWLWLRRVWHSRVAQMLPYAASEPINDGFHTLRCEFDGRQSGNCFRAHTLQVVKPEDKAVPLLIVAGRTILYLVVDLLLEIPRAPWHLSRRNRRSSLPGRSLRPTGRSLPRRASENGVI